MPLVIASFNRIRYSLLKESEEISMSLGNNYIFKEVLGMEVNEEDIYITNENIWIAADTLKNYYRLEKYQLDKILDEIFTTGELSVQETFNMNLRKNESFETEKNSYYSFDVFIAVGFRLKSDTGTNFRKNITRILSEYSLKGFTLNDNYLKKINDRENDYFEELLKRIKAIRRNGGLFKEKIEDLITLSADYNENLEYAEVLTELISNKLECINGKNNVSDMFIDYIEDLTERKIPVHMSEWENILDEFLRLVLQ